MRMSVGDECDGGSEHLGSDRYVCDNASAGIKWQQCVSTYFA